MDTMKITIDGTTLEIEGKKTVLEAARENGIRIPSLCDHPRLAPFSGCRLCLVEVKGSRGFLPSCSLECQDGMEVQTHTPQLRRLRKQILELILSEHPNACLICQEKENCDEFKSTIRKVGEVTGCVLCPNNGRCELQDVVKDIGLDGVGHPSVYRELEVKRGDPFFDRNNNLCILCGRCVRICREVRGLSTLTFVQRGPDTVIGTALDRPLLQSGCQFCGACVDVCPTGALTEKSLKYDSPPDGRQQIVCALCSMGCLLDVHLRGEERIVFTRPAEDGPVNEGQACVKGRFLLKDLVHNPKRITRPRIRRSREWVEVDWEEALDLVAKKLKSYKPEEIGVVGSSQASCEEGFILRSLAGDALRTKNLFRPSVNSPAGILLRTLQQNGMDVGLNYLISECSQAQTIVVVGSNIASTQPIIWLEIMKAVQNGAELILISSQEYPYQRFASGWLRPHPGSEAYLLAALQELLPSGDDREEEKDIKTFADATGLSRTLLVDTAAKLAASESVSYCFGADVAARPDGEAVVGALWNLAAQTSGRVISLGSECNERGLLEMDRGTSAGTWADPAEVLQNLEDRRIKALYQTGPLQLPRKAKLEFRVVQTAFWEESAEQADVILPATTFAESGGVYVNTEGRLQRSSPCVKPQAEARPGWWILSRLSRRIKRQSAPYESPGDIWKDIRDKTGTGFAAVTDDFLREGGSAFINNEDYQEATAPCAVKLPPAPVRPTKAYPLLLVDETNLDSYRGLVFSRMDKAFRLFRDEARVRVNPDDAQQNGWVEAMPVQVESQSGKFSGVLRLDERVTPGTVAASFVPFRFADNRTSHVFPVRLIRGT